MGRFSRVPGADSSSSSSPAFAFCSSSQREKVGLENGNDVDERKKGLGLLGEGEEEVGGDGELCVRQ